MEPISHPGVVLTPVKVGLGYCWTLRDLLNQRLSPKVPGYLRTSLFENSYNDRIAVLEIAHKPVPSLKSGGALTPNNASIETTKIANGEESMTIDQSSGNATAAKNISDLTIPSSREMRWFSCYAKLIFVIVQMPKKNLVTDTLSGPPPGMSSLPAAHHFNCENPYAPGDLIMIFVYPAALRMTTGPTWETVARAALQFGENVAADSSDLRPGPLGPKKDIFLGNVRVLSLKAWIDANPEVNSATA